jgi:hypothetical protein
MPARGALRHLLRPLDLAWVIEDEVLQITTAEQVESRLELRVYPVRDLCEFALDEDLLTQPGGRTVDALMETIMYTVAPDVWDHVGGPGAIAPLGSAGVLVISQTGEVHAKIEELLTQLRKRLAEEREARGEAVKVDPNVLKLVVYDLPQPLPLQNPAPQQQAPAGGAEQPNQGGGGGFFQFGGFGGPYASGTPIPGNDLVEIVTALAAPEAWGREGVYIKAVPGRLIVRQTATVHRKIKSLLVQLGLRSAWDGDGFGGSLVPVVGRR